MRFVLSAALASVLAAAFLVTITSATAAPAVTAAEQGSRFTPFSPVRVLDTRDGTGPVGPAHTIALDLSSRVPANATAVVLNVTAVAPTASTFVTVFPHGQSRPLASNLNVAAGDVRPNLVTVAVGTGRGVDLYNHAGSVHLVADLSGYYAPGSGGLYTAELPERTLDTRQDGGPLGPGGPRVLDLSNSVPPSATAVTFNLTAMDTTASTYVTAWPTGTVRPTASNVNLNGGGTRAILVTVALGANRQVSFYNFAGQVNLVVNETGFYTPEFGATFLPQSPSRVLDTRDGTGGTLGPLGTNKSILVDPNAPLTATAVLMNVTAVDPETSTYVTVWSAPGDNDPSSVALVLDLTYGETAANMTAVALDPADPVRAYNFYGSVHLVADLAGVFVVPTATCTADCAYTWGYNDSWQLGTGKRVQSSPTPAPVVGLSGVTALAGGAPTRYALRNDGSVLAWGFNYFSQAGGGWSSDWSPVPVRIPGLTGVTGLAAGQYHAFALLGDGTVRAWGWMWDGLGNGTNSSGTPVPVTGLTDITAIASADHTGYALRADGTVWSWGSNEYGALGDGSTAQGATTPVQVAGLTGVTAIAAAGTNAYALRNDGSVWAWGRGDQGQLGSHYPCTGAGCGSAVPVQVAGLSGITALAAGNATGYALRADRTVLAWGANDQGQLGNGVDCTACFSATPVPVSNLSDVTALVGWNGVGYALRADGTVWAWGGNTYGGLGNGGPCPPQPTPCKSTAPVRVVGLQGVTAIAPGAAVVRNP